MARNGKGGVKLLMLSILWNTIQNGVIMQEGSEVVAAAFLHELTRISGPLMVFTRQRE